MVTSLVARNAQNSSSATVPARCCSAALARELDRVRTYRPARLRVGRDGVAVGTRHGHVIEKKIDLPDSWVKGFLQVQSAATMPALPVTLSADIVADILALLRRRREQHGPRSIRFMLVPGHTPSVVLEPWGYRLTEPEHVYLGQRAEEVRIWGRRRLLVLESLLPHAETVGVRLLGSGMPSYWSVASDGVRFDLGLSGWTRNDWAGAARFDALAASAVVVPRDLAVVTAALQRLLVGTPADIAERTGRPREVATAALQHLCRLGAAMFDHVNGMYRWRELLPDRQGMDTLLDDPQVREARHIVGSGGVTVEEVDPEDDSPSLGWTSDEPVRRIDAEVRGQRDFRVRLALDEDGRVRYADCGCSWYRRERLRKGPCAHIRAALAESSRVTSGSLVNG